MWAHPRMVGWLMATILALVLVRLPFRGLYLVPYVVDMNPGFLLIPIAGMYFGPAGVLGAVLAAPIGDALCGMWGSLTPVRMLACGLTALLAERLWYGHQEEGPEADAWLARHGRVRMMLVGLPVCFCFAGWIALVGALLRLYPFAYLFCLHLGSTLVFYMLFAPAAHALIQHEWAPTFGTWRTVMADRITPGAQPFLGDVLIWVGGIAAGAVGLLASGLGYGIWPWPIPHLGLRAGIWVWIPVGLGLLVQVVGLVWRERGIPPNARVKAGRGRFDGLYLGPLEKR